MKKKLFWIEVAEALVIHDESLAEHGGREGIRDPALLESALARPKNLLAYSKKPASLTQLADAYAVGVIRNHPFVDGNKRTALLVSFAFLELNGLQIEALPEDIYLTFIGLAEGSVSEKAFAEWLERNAVRISKE